MNILGAVFLAPKNKTSAAAWVDAILMEISPSLTSTPLDTHIEIGAEKGQFQLCSPQGRSLIFPRCRMWKGVRALQCHSS
jgi:hypothetical protein